MYYFIFDLFVVKSFLVFDLFVSKSFLVSEGCGFLRCPCLGDGHMPWDGLT